MLLLVVVVVLCGGINPAAAARVDWCVGAADHRDCKRVIGGNGRRKAAVSFPVSVSTIGGG